MFRSMTLKDKTPDDEVVRLQSILRRHIRAHCAELELHVDFEVATLKMLQGAAWLQLVSKTAA